MSLMVIGTGFGRTGTDSMREALTMLGFGPCHHMSEVMGHAKQKRLWRALARGEAPDWAQLFAGYKSCVDWPSAFYWRELIEAYPQARVILTWRSPESWWESFEKTLLPAIAGSTDQESLGIPLVANQVFGGRPQDRAHAIAVYRDNVEAVLNTVPAGRLLVHKLGDGWAPLCSHLGVPVPEESYPARNTTQEFRSALGIVQ
ncbi:MULTISPECIES: sulfotransferase family protein [unclassified Mesorhizobium]|uniref:sulfotransferase family protein n=1 Tax=unclassified Mesorhizobium TaxID=325217 RepID=UPI000F7595DB|nr:MULTISPECIES: sulfotransferase family protein [unclassified Mesorhizobium]AZO06543.1 sulfotransferase family protein [Mesorhizobium sp. M2A.F.Ca.ET.043.02.1.1]RUW35325.1 sulfotransferase family protein [Mesorhizobium sp. M2A.F.Ca.ET.015.02.1.1]RUW66054.1 sulfotransferase family protein [Mesorhizobium sp. M2A.F.Ca.ET.067.02.1.1]RVC94020.1 sulfotransferase family protein [Mesorhizobium sp. M2A.F.Ca.ET.017.03.2.1]RVD02783.1 sulfotransferase family protein [Mesorhizobium sp. M2A.F.Ca.ET.029.05.